MKKYIKIATPLVLVIIALIFVFSMAYIVAEDEYGIVRQFGKVVKIDDEPGLYFKIPFVNDVSVLPKNSSCYDVTQSDVLTSDKKALVIDSYVIWKIVDPLKFVQSIGTLEEMENRLDAATFSVVKNTMGTMEQSDIIRAGSGPELIVGTTEALDPEKTENPPADGSQNSQSSRNKLNKAITENVNAQIKDEYGVEIISIEVKKLDLPEANEEAVYNRMISDREQIAAQYIAEGNLEASKIRNETDKKVTIIKSEADAEAEEIKGQAEAEYMKILATAFATDSQRSFYEFHRSLDAMKGSLITDKGTKKVLVLPRDSTIAKIFLSE